MKVLWVSHLVPYPPKSGVLARSHHLVRELARYVDLDLVSFVQPTWLELCFGSVDEGLRASRQALSAFCRPLAFLPIASEQVVGGRARLALSSVLSGRPSTVEWLASREARRLFTSLAATTPYDLVHFDTVSLAPYRALFPDSRASLGHHNIESHMLLRRAELETRPIHRWFFAREGRSLLAYERQALGRFDTHITCSTLDCARLREIAPHPSVVDIPNGVDLDYFRESEVDRVPNSLVFAGTMDWYPNVDAMTFMLKDVWPLLKAARPAITFGIVGRNPPQWMLDLAAQDPAVRVYGYVDDVRPYLAGASVYVCPIRDGGGTKLKILDALAMARCIVAHPIACEGIDVVDGESAVLASDAATMAASILSLLQDPVRAEAIGRRGRALAEARYSFAMIGRQLSRHFADIVAGGRNQPAPASRV
jgi:glycosyltransferase involved in cell wall biosynthesis